MAPGDYNRLEGRSFDGIGAPSAAPTLLEKGRSGHKRDGEREREGITRKRAMKVKAER